MVKNLKLEQVSKQEQVTEQETKYKSFEELNPVYGYLFANWDTFSDQAKSDAIGIICGDAAHCVLGEGSGGSSWNGADPKCWDCKEFGNEPNGFPAVFKDELDIDWPKYESIKERYVKHMNERHIK